MSVYTREFQFEAEGGAPACIPLPCHMRGALTNLKVAQIGGTDGFTFSVFDRSGACAAATDKFVKGGPIASITDNGDGLCRIEVDDEADMVGVQVGDTVEVKGSDVNDYNVLTHLVTAIVSDTEFDTDQAYVSDGAAQGVWQTAPAVFPTLDPSVHLVVPAVTVAGGNASGSISEAEHFYQNRDNQDVNARRMQSSLYLEITPGGIGAKTFVVSYTARSCYVVG